MPCNSCKKPKFEQAKISPLLARYQKFKNTPQKVNSSINRTPVKKPSRVFTTSKPKTSTIDRRREIMKKLNANKSKKVTLSSSTLLQIKSIEKGWIKVPSWFKNNVAWVKEGKISESEFNSGLQSAITQANKNRVTKPIQKAITSTVVTPTKIDKRINETFVVLRNGKLVKTLRNPMGSTIDSYERSSSYSIMKKSDYDKRNRASRPIRNTPISVPVNTTPVIESIPEVVKKDCGWFGEKCAFDGVTKAFDEAGKGLDVFVKEEQKKQDASWNWFNTGVKETQDGIANFFENEGKKQKESWQALDDSVESTKSWVDSGIKWFQGGIELERQKQEKTLQDLSDNADQLRKDTEQKLKDLQDAGNSVITVITDGAQNLGDFANDVNTNINNLGGGLVQFGEDVQTNIGALGTGLDQFGKDLQTNVAGIGEGLDQFGKDMQKNIMILGAVGLGAVVLMGMRK